MWKTVRMNWNHVCNGSIVRAALHMVRDPKYLASMTYHAIQHLTYAHDGFTDDGGCEEGPDYWGFGFGHYLYVAHAVHHRTGGELNLMDNPKIERICQYPLASNIAGNIARPSPIRDTATYRPVSRSRLTSSTTSLSYTTSARFTTTVLFSWRLKTTA